MSDERKAFERMLRLDAEELEMNPRLDRAGGEYKYRYTQCAWWGWNARARLQAETRTHHSLKILSCYYEAVMNGSKRFEIRENDDRGFQKGDTVVFVESPIATTKGRETPVFVITYVTNYGQPDGQVVFGFKEIGE